MQQLPAPTTTSSRTSTWPNASVPTTLLVVGGSGLEVKLENVPLKANKHMGKVLDVSSKDLDAALTEAVSEVS